MTKTTKKPVKAKTTPEQIKQQANNKALGGLYGNEGVNAGNALINKFLPEGALGRVSTDVPGATQSLERSNALLQKAGTSPDQQAALDGMKAGLGGYTSPEYQASREQMMRGVNSDYATSQGQLAKAQARGKVYGAAGAAQQANLAASTQTSKDNLEQDLMVKNIDEQQNRLKTYGDYAASTQKQGFDQNEAATSDYNNTEAGLRGEELDREKVNLGQADSEIAGRIGAFQGAGSTALTKSQTASAQDIQRQGIAAINGNGSTTAKAQAKAAKTIKK